MEKLIAELMRLYLLPGMAPERVARHLHGQELLAAEPAGGLTRVIVLPFAADGSGGDAHWRALCELAGILQVQYGFPAPAVSISGADSFELWLSLAAPVPVAQARQFVERLLRAHLLAGATDTGAPVPLPPCLNAASGKWAAFINPGMGVSFIDEAGLEVAPPPAAQAAFLEGLESIDPARFARVLAALEPVPGPASAADAASAPATAAPGAWPGNLLLREATLDDIIRYLHARDIEPTLRHLHPSVR